MVSLVYSCACLVFYKKETKKDFIDVISSFQKAE